MAREIIKDQVVTNRYNALPWKDAEKYSKRILSYSIRDFERLAQSENLYFFDRGIPDILGYERLMNFEFDTELLNAISKYRYNETVFILPPWKEFYETDSERIHDFDIVAETYHIMKKTYGDMKYNSITQLKYLVCLLKNGVTTHYNILMICFIKKTGICKLNS